MISLQGGFNALNFSQKEARSYWGRHRNPCDQAFLSTRTLLSGSLGALGIIPLRKIFPLWTPPVEACGAQACQPSGKLLDNSGIFHQPKRRVASVSGQLVIGSIRHMGKTSSLKLATSAIKFEAEPSSL